MQDFGPESRSGRDVPVRVPASRELMRRGHHLPTSACVRALALRDTEHCAGLPLEYLFAPIPVGVERG